VDYPNLRYAMPDELSALVRLLRAERAHIVEVHHFLGHHPAVYQLLRQLGLPYVVHIHDYPWFCQRVSLVGAHDRYCGEPEPAECEACVADVGRVMEEEISVTALLQRSAAFLASAGQVVAPSEDAAQRMRRHFPNLRPIVVPHADDMALPEPAMPRARNGRCLVCVVGAIGVHKGYDVLLDCARDAFRRNLPLDFVVVGTSIDDARLMQTGRIFVTGRYQPHEAVDLIRRQEASLALLPSIWPETWCLGLSEIWRAGLRAAAFDIGTPAERIRRSGWGFLFPPGLPPHAINNRLVAIVGLSRH
jgi:glycosyltransferase involved in cell wall biosynthesis